jgi:hypothetical protein
MSEHRPHRSDVTVRKAVQSKFLKFVGAGQLAGHRKVVADDLEDSQKPPEDVCGASIRVR